MKRYAAAAWLALVGTAILGFILLEAHQGYVWAKVSLGVIVLALVAQISRCALEVLTTTSQASEKDGKNG